MRYEEGDKVLVRGLSMALVVTGHHPSSLIRNDPAPEW